MSTGQPAVVATRPSPLRQAGDRLLEVVPGLVTWTLLLAPAWIPLIFASTGAFVVAVAVLVFDVYWFFRSFQVIIGVWSTYLKMRRDMSVDWLARCQEAPPEGCPDPLSFYQLSIIPTYTEPYHVLEKTVRAIVESNYPRHLKLIGIITRVTDKPGWANVDRLREEFGDQLGGFFHIKDPMEPPLVPVGRHELGRPGHGEAARGARLRPAAGAAHGPRLRLPRAPGILRLDQLPPRPGPAARLRDLAACPPLSQQHLAGSHRRQGDVGELHAVADVPSFAA
jgi:hypothetical protein